MLQKQVKILIFIFAASIYSINLLAEEVSPADIINRTAVIQEAKTQDIDSFISQANKAYLDKDYPRAKDLYLSAISNISSTAGSNTDAAQKKIASLSQSLSNVYTAWSQQLLQEAKENSAPEQIDKSIELCKEAKEMNPACGDLADRLIAYYTESRKNMEYDKAFSKEKLLPDHKEKLHNIDVLYEQGKLLYNKKLFNQAKDKFQELLLIDPYNTNAIEYIRQINLKIIDAGNYRTQVTATQRSAEIEWEKLSPIMSRTLSGERVDLVEADTFTRKDSTDALNEKLRSITIKNISFEHVPIDTAVTFLKNESQKEDPSGKGVNFFLRLEPLLKQTNPQGTASAENQTEGWDQSSNQATQQNIANDYQVTLVLENVSLGKAVDYITKAAGLKYSVGRYAVEIYSPNIQESNLFTEVIAVEREYFLDVTSENTTTDMKQFFQERGILFQENASCVYDPKISRLIIRNNPFELEKVKAVLASMENNTLPQVSILAKFVEMRQSIFEELGFQWNFSKTGGDVTVKNPTQINRFLDDNPSPVGTTKPDREFGLLYETGGYTVGGTIHALEQNQRVEILSAPRVTTLSGQKATIRLITDRYFPINWTEPTITRTQTETSVSSTTTTTIIPPTPEVSMQNPTPIGIRLDVTPQVSSDNYTIDMVLEPQVQDFVGWTYYNYSASDTRLDQDFVIKMPVISARNIQTQVRVFDGETVILGGVYKDETQMIIDTIPILGEIPLVGRLFQTEIEAPDKTNLLIFTTVQLIRPDGTPLRPSRNAGMPTFRD